jgi:diguanylate cyclase (GGDEF)-like protein
VGIARFILKDKWWTLACGLVLVESILCLTLPRSFGSTAAGDITQCCLIFLALRASLSNLSTQDQRSRLFWTLLSLGFVLWLCAQLLWSYFEVILRQEVPNPFVGDVVLFLHLVPMMAALAVRPHLERDEQIGHLGAIDFALLITWWLYLYVFAVIPWQFVWPNEAIYGRSFDSVYLVGHLAFVAGAAAVWLRSTGPWRVTYAALFGAGLVYALGSMTAGAAIDLGRYYTGSFYDVPLLASMACFTAVGSIARRLNLNADAIKTVREKREIWVSGAATLAILSLPMMAAWAFYLSDAPQPVRNFRLQLTLASMIVMGTLAWIKQYRLDKELARSNRDLREDSLTDVLTGVRNRRFLSSSIEADVRHVMRSYSRSAAANGKRDRDLVFYLVDADAFKEINDHYGHATGDRVLVEIVRRISSAIRHSDALIRWGGDEFLVVSRYTDRDEASHLAKRVLQAMANQPFEIEGCVSMRCTCSVGWAVFPWYVRDPKRVGYEDVLRLADAALYEAKKAGRNQAVGMLPGREEPASGTTLLAGKNSRLAEQLGAQAVTILGPVAQKPPQPVVDAKAVAATQGI